MKKIIPLRYRYEKNVETEMVSNYTNITKANIHLSPQTNKQQQQQKTNKQRQRTEMCLYVECKVQIINNSFSVHVLLQ